MAAPFKLVEVSYNAEASFLENVNSLGSLTYGTRIPVLSYTLQTPHERIRDGAVQSRSNAESLSHIGPRGIATLEFTTYAIGHQAATTGALTETWQQDLMSDGLGGGSTAAVGTTLSAATTASSMTFTSTSGWAVGMGARVGSKGDGRADGQIGILATVASPCTFLTAFPGTPQAADVVYAMQVAYHDETVMSTLGTKRFLVAYSSTPTTGAQYHLLGGQLAGLRFNLPVNGSGLPTITWSYRFAYWERSAVATPSSTALSTGYCGPLTGGSLFLQNNGTATRSTITASEIDISLDLGLEMIPGTGSAASYGFVTGWQRTMCKPSIRVRVPWVTTYETAWDLAPQSYNYYHVLLSGSTFDGRAVGAYIPRCFLVGNRPSQPVEANGQLYVDFNLVGVDSTVTTTELTKSAFRWLAG